MDTKLEETFRELTGHAIHKRDDDVARVIAEAGERGYGQVLGLVIQACAYICIDAAERWPTAADLQETVRLAAKEGGEVSADEVHRFLSGTVFGNSEFDGHPLTPLYTLASLLTSFKPPMGQDWNDYLDVIESAIEAADQARPTDLPAMTYRYLKK